MPYCTDCGEEINSDASFCPSCGEEVGESKTETTEEIDTDSIVENRWETTDESTKSVIETGSEEVQWNQLIASGIVGLFVGFQIVFAFSGADAGINGVLFIGTFTGVTSFLYYRTDSSKESLATGLYIIAAWFILVPLIFYLVVAGQSPNQFAAVGAVLGMVIYGFIGLLLAIVTAGVGYFVNSRYVD